MNLPVGAKPILEMRRDGIRPEAPVLVSLIGRLPHFDGPCVIAEPGERYDWAFIAGLEVVVWVREGVNARRIFIDLAKAGARMPVIWDVDKARGGWLQVDWPFAVDAAVHGAMDDGDARRAQSAFDRRFDGPGVQVWLAAFGPVMNSQYAADAAPMVQMLKERSNENRT